MSEQKDIWVEKPDSVYKDLTSYGHYYEANSMDAWLERVKAEIVAGKRLRKAWGEVLGEVGVCYEVEGEWYFDPEKWRAFKEKAGVYDSVEFITKKTSGGETLEIYHIDEFASAIEDKREAERKLEASEKEGLEHHAIAVEYYEKLEAVKKWCEAYKPPKRSFNKLNQAPFIQLEKILGGD